MSFFNFFQNLFAGGNNQRPPNDRYEEHWEPRHSFRNPIWQNDEDDDDEIGDNDFRNPRHGFHFHIFSDPLQITKFFETEMDNMLKGFFSGFGQGEITSPFGNDEVFKALPHGKPQRKENLRDEFLKPGYEQPALDQSGFSKPKVDADLDGKVSTDELMKVWTKPSTSQEIQTYSPNRQFNIQSFGKSIITRSIRRPDGTMEQHRTVKDSEGNEETTVTRQIGDKTHTVVTKLDKNGIQTTTENLVNIDENELKDFEKKWSIQPQPRNDFPLSNFPWHKFFSPSPKL
ncbi:HCLS1-associated protein X-1 [Cephus cinctus]|uniref:HCLS1-associated protein X-1 n=1 Tax=Cephus cinctus TaxID=211228 RepID=A0AAJ7FR05_CEPCN|nr:HCLS1-associated protein X-1 [Cephus cinctus]XP_015603978.1 HCLS1-associated protein X-1 [Cephus cinctus]